MYERFTDRARKVMQLANQECQRFNHEYIGTEHLLIGLAKEGSGVASNVLKNMGVSLAAARVEVEKIIIAGPQGQMMMGKIPHSPRLKKVIEYAIDEAKLLNHNYVGTEHLLLGLVREKEGVAAQVLFNLGVKLEDVRQAILDLLNPKKDEADKLEDARDEAIQVAANALMMARLAIDSCLRVLGVSERQVAEWAVKLEVKKD
jgi:ATP-dependent Clp protease ATP-binding subunit ClpC